MTCPRPDAPDNGRIVGGSRPSYDVGDTVEYECDPGFDRDGPRKVTCQSNGKFSDGPPECVPGKTHKNVNVS